MITHSQLQATIIIDGMTCVIAMAMDHKVVAHMAHFLKY